MPNNKRMQQLLHSQTNVNGIHKEESSEPVIERNPIDKTPFWLIKHEGVYDIVLGNMKLSRQPFKTMEEVEEYLNTETYNILMAMILFVNQKENKNERLPTNDRQPQ